MYLLLLEIFRELHEKCNLFTRHTNHIPIFHSDREMMRMERGWNVDRPAITGHEGQQTRRDSGNVQLNWNLWKDDIDGAMAVYFVE